MLSRVAERMYWAGRYLERAENTARLVKVHGHMLLDMPPEAGRTWEQLLTIFDAQQAFGSRYAEPSETNVVKFFVADTDNTGSVMMSLGFLRENVRTTRDIVPTEGWECVNELYLFAQSELPDIAAERTSHRALSQVISGCQRLTGLLSGTMSHGPGYHFLRLGRNLERADMTTRILDVPAATLLHTATEFETYQYTLWMNVLKSLSAYQMYCQFVRRRVVGEDVIEFLLHDDLFPRSLQHCLDEVSAALERLPRPEQALKGLREIDADLKTARDATMDAAALHDYLDTLQCQLGSVHDHIVTTWFLPANRQ